MAKTVAEYSEKIRSLRQVLGVTQKGLAKRISANTTTVGRWEAAMREPNIENYAALASLAEEKAPDLANFFVERKRSMEVTAEQKERISFALFKLEHCEQEAASGNHAAKRRLEAVSRGPAEFRKYLDMQLRAAKLLENGDYLSQVQWLGNERATLETLWFAREVRAGRMSQAEKRQAKRLSGLRKEEQFAYDALARAKKERFEIMMQVLRSLQRRLAASPEGDTARGDLLSTYGEIMNDLAILGNDEGYRTLITPVESALSYAAKRAEIYQGHDDNDKWKAAVQSFLWAVSSVEKLKKDRS